MSETAREVRARLREAKASVELVTLRRRVAESERLTCWIVAASSTWAIVRPLGERLDLDGYEAVRVADLRAIEPTPHPRFYEKCLRFNGHSPASATALEPLPRLASTGALLADLGARFELLAVHREVVKPDAWEVGAIVATDESSYRLKEVSAHGETFTSDSLYPLRDVTRISFGRTYETVLARVRKALAEGPGSTRRQPETK